MNALNSFLSSSGGSRHLATAACIGLIAVIAMSLADGTMFYLENQQTDELTPALSRGQNATSRPKIPSIANLNIFGEIQENQSTPEVFDAPTTSLNLELQGVFASLTAENSTAIIASKGKTGELYNIGDRLPGNAILNAVHSDHVLIKRGSRIEKLPFFDSALSKQFNAQPNRKTSSRRGSSSHRVNLGQEAALSGNSRLQQLPERLARRKAAIEAKRYDSSAKLNLKDQLSAYKTRLDENPQQVLNELGVTAVGESDSSGYRIGSEVSQSLLRQSGLRQGDLILSVNGQAVGNVTNDKALIDIAVAAGRARVEIQRGSRRFYVTVPIPK